MSWAIIYKHTRTQEGGRAGRQAGGQAGTSTHARTHRQAGGRADIHTHTQEKTQAQAQTHKHKHTVDIPQLPENPDISELAKRREGRTTGSRPRKNRSWLQRVAPARQVFKDGVRVDLLAAPCWTMGWARGLCTGLGFCGVSPKP